MQGVIRETHELKCGLESELGHLGDYLKYPESLNPSFVKKVKTMPFPENDLRSSSFTILYL